jgi:hypothetical protein
MVTIDCPTNTTDLINGLFVTINTPDKSFDYCDAYELLPKIQNVFYDILGQKPYTLQPNSRLPKKKDLDTLFIMQNLFGVYSIGMNRTGDKTHIHLWVYNLHSFSLPYRQFQKKLSSGLKKLKGISKRNEFGVKIIPCYDTLDAEVRRSNYNSQVIIDYVANKDYDTLMNYFASKNDKNFIYFY